MKKEGNKPTLAKHYSYKISKYLYRNITYKVLIYNVEFGVLSSIIDRSKRKRNIIMSVEYIYNIHSTF